LGEVHALLGRPETAVSYFMQAGALYERANARTFANTTHEGLAITLTMRGRFEEAAVEARAAVSLATDLGNVKAICDAKNMLGRALEGAGKPEEAIVEHLEALAIAQDTSYPWGNCAARRGLAAAYRAVGRVDDALGMARESLDRAQRYQFRLAEMDVLVTLGRVQLDTGDVSSALDCAMKAASLGETSGQRLAHARAMHLAGDALQVNGSAEEARKHWKVALDLFVEIGTPEAEVVRSQLDVTT